VASVRPTIVPHQVDTFIAYTATDPLADSREHDATTAGRLLLAVAAEGADAHLARPALSDALPQAAGTAVTGRPTNPFGPMSLVTERTRASRRRPG
jgi:hypothetical protein